MVRVPGNRVYCGVCVCVYDHYKLDTEYTPKIQMRIPAESIYVYICFAVVLVRITASNIYFFSHN